MGPSVQKIVGGESTSNCAETQGTFPAQVAEGLFPEFFCALSCFTTTTTTSLFLALNIQISHHLQIARLIEAGGVWTA